ncbi:MAG: TetR/AcrR family transcriptional regulator [Bacillota bacterium]
MPTERFRNLSQEKRERIDRAAIDELAELGFEGATVAGVVRRAQIPRGSFYQYFADMSDLIAYVFGLIVEAKLVYLGDTLALAGKIPVLDYYRAVFAQGLAFAEARPEFLGIGRHMYQSHNPALREQVKQGMTEWHRLLSPLVKHDQEKGLIRPDVDPDLTARLLATMLTEALLEELYREHRSAAEVMAFVDHTVGILKHGLMK